MTITDRATPAPGAPSCVWQTRALLGEGPVWLAEEGALWFTDIKGRRLHRFRPADGETRSIDMPFEPGFVVPAEGGGLLVGGDNALHLFDGTRLTARIAALDAPGGTRINDGTTDRLGRVWFGTMDDAELQKIGAVHMHDGDGIVLEAGGHAVITNGPAVSACASLLYHVDTASGLIWRFSIAQDHRLRGGEVFVAIDPAHGHPDGVTLDRENCLWVCLWGGWCVRRYAPDGTLLTEIPFPVAQVTKLAFGGPDLATAYVTTARKGLSDAALAAQPLAGGLFAFPAGTAGLPAEKARLPA